MRVRTRPPSSWATTCWPSRSCPAASRPSRYRCNWRVRAVRTSAPNCRAMRWTAFSSSVGLGRVVGRGWLGQEAGGHLVGEASEVVMDLDLQSGDLGGVVSQSVPPLRLEGLGLLTEGPEEIVIGGDQRTGLGLEAHLHGQL